MGVVMMDFGLHCWHSYCTNYDYYCKYVYIVREVRISHCIMYVSLAQIVSEKCGATNHKLECRIVKMMVVICAVPESLTIAVP